MPNDVTLAYGLHRAIPDDVTHAWGARLIAPADLVWDRQDLCAPDPIANQRLVRWLNGEPSGTGAIHKMREFLRTHHMPQDRSVRTLYEDDGIIVGSTNQSYGYVYVAGWLKERA